MSSTQTVAKDYIKNTYADVADVIVMDVEAMGGGRMNFAGTVMFADGSSKGFDFATYVDGTFDSMPSRTKGHVDLWDFATREVMPVG